MRHAKSSWANLNQNDHERPLNERGRKDAPEMGLRLKENGYIPDIIYSSDSMRTRETYEGLSKSIGSVPVIFLSALYHASAGQILKSIHQADTTKDIIMILAHNPGITDAFELLADVRIDNVPTSGLGVIDFDVQDVKSITARTGKMILFDYPKAN